MAEFRYRKVQMCCFGQAMAKSGQRQMTTHTVILSSVLLPERFAVMD